LEEIGLAQEKSNAIKSIEDAATNTNDHDLIEDSQHTFVARTKEWVDLVKSNHCAIQVLDEWLEKGNETAEGKNYSAPPVMRRTTQ